MKLFNWEITKSAKTARPIVANSNGSFAGTIKEAFTGSWQRNIEYTNESVLTNPTPVYYTHLTLPTILLV